MGLASEQSGLDIADIDWSSTLLSTRSHHKADLPFALFECPNFIDDTAYEALVSEYPSAEHAWLENYRLDTKIDISSNGPNFEPLLDRSPIWRSFVDHVRSETFRRDVMTFCWPVLQDYAARDLIANDRVLEVARGFERKTDIAVDARDELSPRPCGSAI